MSKKSSDEVIKCEINYNEIYDLVGKLLTYIDATFIDQEQRKAQKTLVKHLVYGWYDEIEKFQHPDYNCEITVNDGGTHYKGTGVDTIN